MWHLRACDQRHLTSKGIRWYSRLPVMLGPGLARSPQLLLAMAWLVGAKKVADRHSSPSSSAGQYARETRTPSLISSLCCCIAPHAPRMDWPIASRQASGSLPSQQPRDSLADFVVILSPVLSY